MKRIYLIIYICFCMAALAMAQAVREVAPAIDYSRTPRWFYIGGIRVEGVQNYDESLLVGLSGLTVGDRIEIPGDEISKAVKRFWRNGLFDNVAISVDSLVGDSAYLHIQLTQRPRISQINYSGVKKSEIGERQPAHAEHD